MSLDIWQKEILFIELRQQKCNLGAIMRSLFLLVMLQELGWMEMIFAIQNEENWKSVRLVFRINVWYIHLEAPRSMFSHLNWNFKYSTPPWNECLIIFPSFSWFHLELFAGNRREHATYRNTVRANHHFALQTSIRWMVPHARMTGHIATMECVWPTSSNVCSFGDMVRRTNL